VYFRNGVVANFPEEEKERARQFGTFIYDAYRGEFSEKIKERGALPPGDILCWKNTVFKDFDIDFRKL